MMNFLAGIFSLMPLRWWVALIVSVLGIAAICIRVLETDRARAKRAERKKKSELVMKAMGHSDVRTAMRYQHPALDSLREVIDQRNLRHNSRHNELRVQ
jgi:hypothetical protein